ncbi:MAG: dihydrofolate reductase [Gammaproteobacteria bacterium]|nr:dihydrofolate reductase [Gammaproteobacteria bacterium]
MKISLIWAMADNRLIGAQNSLPWRLPKDMQHFMRVTMDKPVIMGRKTFASMKAPLPRRTNIVITRDESWAREGVVVANNLEAAMMLAQRQCSADGQDEMMIIGGADIYALALPYATHLYVTHVHAKPAGDIYFPDLDLSLWQCESNERHEADEKHFAAFTIALYTRREE